MTPGEQAFEDFEAGWEAEVNARVEQMETLALVLLMQRGTEAAVRRLRAAEHDLQTAIRNAQQAREALGSATTSLDEAIRLAARFA